MHGDLTEKAVRSAEERHPHGADVKALVPLASAVALVWLAPAHAQPVDASVVLGPRPQLLVADLPAGELKARLAQQFPDDIDSYIAGKTEFVLGILRKVGLTDEEIAEIRSINQLENLARPASS